jgi:hypothetical protein
MVRIHPDPPIALGEESAGAIAQLGERLLCKQEVIGSIPIGSTRLLGAGVCEGFCRDAHLATDVRSAVL